MHNYLTLFFIILSLLFLPSTSLAKVNADAENERYIIKFKKGGHASLLNAVNSHKGKVKRELDNYRAIAVELPAVAIAQLKKRADVELVELDPKRYLLAQSTPYGITMVEANQVTDIAVNVAEMKVCIMDTGYDINHQDLPSNGVTGSDGYGVYDSGNWFEDGHGHGTHVSGTIAALGNSVGVVGVNPSGFLPLHMVKVFNSSGNWAYGSDLVAAVGQCIDAGAKVISMSLGGGGSSTVEQEAFDDAYAAGLLSIAAAGNSGNSSLSYPASYDSVISVAAVDANANVASFSQYNSQVEIAAPGVGINSTLPGNNYEAWSGTSMATPHVAGVAALVWSHYLSCTNEQMRIALANSAQDRGSVGRDNNYGYGIVKAKVMFDLIGDATDCNVGDFPAEPEPTDLINGVVVNELSGVTGESIEFKLELLGGASNLVFTMSGGTGDADLYVRFASKPTLSSYDCRPWANGNAESCSFATPQTGIYYVMINAYSSFSGVSLMATFDVVEPNDPPVSLFTYDCTDLSCDFDGSGSTDENGNHTIVSYSWEFEGAVSASAMEESHTYTAAGDYKVTLTVTDDKGASHASSQDVTVIAGPVNQDIILTYIIESGRRTTDVILTWEHAQGGQVEIHRTKRNKTKKITTANDGLYKDSLRKGGTYRYKVCELGGSVCSAEISVDF